MKYTTFNNSLCLMCFFSTEKSSIIFLKILKMTPPPSFHIPGYINVELFFIFHSFPPGRPVEYCLAPRTGLWIMFRDNVY